MNDPMESSRRIPVSIIVGGLIIALALYVSMGGHFFPASKPHSSISFIRAVGAADHMFGNPVAPIVIVEYADFDCDYCKGFFDTLHSIVANTGTKGEVAWVYREFPLTELHPNALAHARASECAGQVAGNTIFWDFAGLLYANQPVDPSTYGALAERAGVPGDAFLACYTDAAAQVGARIEADRRNALDIGAPGTPFAVILVQGKVSAVIDGAYSYDAVKQLVDQARTEIR